MAVQNLGDSVRRFILEVLRQDQQPYTRGQLIIRLHENHPPNENWPEELQTVTEDQLDFFLNSLEDQIVRYRDDVNHLRGDPYWYAIRQNFQPIDTFTYTYRRDRNGNLYRQE